jgi:hypothetical protein
MDSKIMPRLYWARLLVSSSFLIAISGIYGANAPIEGPRWKGTIPKGFDKPEPWIELTKKLVDENMYYGAVATAEQLDLFFNDVSSKETAFEALIKSIDRGYPFSVEEYFKTGFLEPDPKSTLGQSYYFYKGKLNDTQGRKKWATYYFSFLTTDKSPKFLFFQAISAYKNKELPKALEILDKILKLEAPVSMSSFFAKAARTKARILYEMKEYKSSLDIYQNFLLKMNPSLPTDWIEAGWNLFYLERYEETLGYLFNLELKSSRSFINLENYILRASVYKTLCAQKEMAALSQIFEQDFGSPLENIRRGSELKSIDVLVKLRLKEVDEFQKYFFGLNQLRIEKSYIPKLPSELRPLAERIYQSEEAYIKRMAQARMLPFLDKAAESLVILGESLKFLSFDVDRSQFNPDVVFLQQKASTEKLDPLVEDKKGYEVRWLQKGDFWRDERLAYRVALKNQCALSL